MSKRNTSRFAVVSLWAEDVPAAAHFYRDVLRLPELPLRHGERPHFDLDGVILTILQGRPAPAGDMIPERFPLFALHVENLEIAVSRLHDHGVKTPWGFERGGDARWAMFHDPAGNLIELVEFDR